MVKVSAQQSGPLDIYLKRWSMGKIMLRTSTLNKSSCISLEGAAY